MNPYTRNHESTAVKILKDVFDGIEHFYGKKGLDQVTHYALLRNRSRETNKVMDDLEALFGPFDVPDLVGSQGTPK